VGTQVAPEFRPTCRPIESRAHRSPRWLPSGIIASMTEYSTAVVPSSSCRKRMKDRMIELDVSVNDSPGNSDV